MAKGMENEMDTLCLGDIQGLYSIYIYIYIYTYIMYIYIYIYIIYIMRSGTGNLSQPHSCCCWFCSYARSPGFVSYRYDLQI